ncbi:putative acyltransferase [Flavobacterium cauense R2A-7]|uniref:ElaA protein n=1 Tax=Flavobacterium cauense R2A-7 TaxID=1341154 RepID=V6S6M4_9FLAO|nr:GNAT family N-acetyltransferase [Flavobacterium cauense]ESU22049.1 putative acyltransferase [Flavobacterium cauense R2A-7]KGO81285.1 GNAT family acetyltransferase [Flavobacterium cauense R2A-7]TWI13269.1 ElaA protein [Flavobacterium cauense R2A-7]
MKPKFEIKPFKALSLSELYQILQLRSEVFVVEQKCVYQDIDGKDEKALHLLGVYDGVLVAYARLFQPGDYFEFASIGRVIVKQEYRDKKWGHDLIREAIKGISEQFGTSEITISAQLYLQRFYENHGFIQTSEMYLEDDIPHIEMKKA